MEWAMASSGKRSQSRGDLPVAGRVLRQATRRSGIGQLLPGEGDFSVNTEVEEPITSTVVADNHFRFLTPFHAGRFGASLPLGPVGLVRARLGTARGRDDRPAQAAVDPNHLYGMSRHFVWLIPLTNL